MIKMKKHIHTRANVLIICTRSRRWCSRIWPVFRIWEKKKTSYLIIYLRRSLLNKRKNISPIKRNGNTVTAIPILSFLKVLVHLNSRHNDCFSKHTVILTFRRMRSSYVLSSHTYTHADLRRQFVGSRCTRGAPQFIVNKSLLPNHRKNLDIKSSWKKIMTIVILLTQENVSYSLKRYNLKMGEPNRSKKFYEQCCQTHFLFLKHAMRKKNKR